MSTPTVGAYVMVPADCAVTYAFEVGNDIAMQLGPFGDGFEIIFERATLETFTKVAALALLERTNPDPEHAGALAAVGSQ